MTAKKSFRRRLPGLIGALFLLLVAGGLVMVIKNFMTTEPDKKPRVQQISLIKPPEPKPEEKPPEPEKKPPEVKEEVKLDQPPPPEPQAADAPPPGPDLGVDAKGDGGGDQFGLVGKPGGRELTTIGGGAAGNPWGRYDALLNEAVNSAFQNALAREKALKDKNYKVVVKVWIDASGKVTRAALVDSTGDARADEVLKAALRDMRALREAPPADMPQPVKIRVTSRA